MLKNTKINESGRSMVEMLGVLAVMGVLSVAGIEGYSTAMNQYRANEAVNQAVRLAMMVSAQRLINANATLTENDLAGTKFSMTDTSDNIVLTLSNVDAKVRSRIQAMGFKNATVEDGQNGALVFTFNNDLSERPTGTSGGNSGSNQQQQNDPCANVTCQNGGTCSNGECDCTGTGYTGTYCETAEIIACSSNTQCTEANTFCQMTSSTEGTCQEIPASMDEYTPYMSYDDMNFWTAQNWCWAKGYSKLVSEPISCRCSSGAAYNTLFNQLLGIKTAFAAAPAGSTSCMEIGISPTYCAFNFWSDSERLCGSDGTGTLRCSSVSKETLAKAICGGSSPN